MKRSRVTWPWVPLFSSLAIHAAVVGGIATTGTSKPTSIPVTAAVVHKLTHTVGNSAYSENQVEASDTSGDVDVSDSPNPAQTSPRSSTLPDSPGLTNSDLQDGRNPYAELVRRRIDERLQYPLSLRRRGIQGRVRLRLTLDRAGRATSLEVAETSGSAELDALATEAARESQPYPEPPSPVVLNLPIEFKLR